MIELTTKAEKYAVEKTNEVMVKAIAQAYADGYRDGYKDREEEIPVDLHDKKTEFVDLGLPSGTLWAKDYETDDNDKTIYLPYHTAEEYQLPTEEQWNELLEICRWKGEYSSSGLFFYGVTCIGPNGNSIYLRSKGYVQDKEILYGGIYFWISDNGDTNEKNAIHVSEGTKRIPEKEIVNFFSGYKLPIRIVRTKSEGQRT
jgi:hypothetical protein